MRFGNSAAFLCITKKGAMPSMPLRCSVDEFNKKYFSNWIYWEKIILEETNLSFRKVKYLNKKMLLDSYL